jgi:biotin-(acetyl-CoA carboxylase) ligase
MIYKNYPVFEDSILLGYAKFIETDGYLVIETPKNEYKKIANGSIKLR